MFNQIDDFAEKNIGTARTQIGNLIGNLRTE